MSFETAQEAFSADSYDTPENTRRYIGDRILFNSRWWLYLRFASVVINSSRMARKGKYDDEAWIKASFRVFQHIEGCGGRFHIRGLDNLKKTREPLIVISNHMSTLETVIFPCLIVPFRPMTFVVKEALVKGKVFGPIMRLRNPITVSRTNPREDFRAVLEQGKKILVIDLDPQGNATTGLGLSNTEQSDQTIYGILNGTMAISNVIKKTKHKMMTDYTS